MKRIIAFFVMQFFLSVSVNAQTLVDLIASGTIQIVEITGNGNSSGTALEGVLRNRSGSQVTIDVHLVQPIYFRNQGRAQNMIATQIYNAGGQYSRRGSRSYIAIPSNTQVRVSFVAYCADFERDNPSSRDRFSVQAMPSNLRSAATRIAAYEAANPQRDTTVASQVALWLSAGLPPEQIRTQFSFTPDDLALARSIIR